MKKTKNKRRTTYSGFSIVERDRSYQISVTVGYDNGKQKRVFKSVKKIDGKTERQMLRIVEEIAEEFAESVKNGNINNRLTFEGFSKKWLNDYAQQNLAITTYEHYKDYLERIINPKLGKIYMDDLKPLHLNSFISSLITDGYVINSKHHHYTRGTIKKIMAIVSSILQTAVYWQVIKENPCERVKIPKITQEKKERKMWSADEAMAFLEYVRSHYKPQSDAHFLDLNTTYQIPLLFYLAVFTGARRGEILALTWSDINYDNKTIRINKSLAEVNGKPIVKDTKNESSTRTVHVTDDVLQLLREWKKERNLLRIRNRWETDADLVFVQANGSHMDTHTPYHTLQKLIKRYNKEKNKNLTLLTFHELRHLHASIMINAGVDIQTVSARLGHADTQTTLSIYSHIINDADSHAIDIFAKKMQKI